MLDRLSRDRLAHRNPLARRRVQAPAAPARHVARRQTRRTAQTSAQRPPAPARRRVRRKDRRAKSSRRHAEGKELPLSSQITTSPRDIAGSQLSHRRRSSTVPLFSSPHDSRSLAVALMASLSIVATARADDGRWSFSSGAEYTTGDYGETQDTTIIIVPFTFGYRTDRWGARITIPWVSIEGPGTIVPGSSGSAAGGAGGLSGLLGSDDRSRRRLARRLARRRRPARRRRCRSVSAHTDRQRERPRRHHDRRLGRPLPHRRRHEAHARCARAHPDRRRRPLARHRRHRARGLEHARPQLRRSNRHLRIDRPRARLRKPSQRLLRASRRRDLRRAAHPAGRERRLGASQLRTPPRLDASDRSTPATTRRPNCVCSRTARPASPTRAPTSASACA